MLNDADNHALGNLDLKLAVWVSMGIATAFMGGFLLFGALGVSITMISLFGLIIVLGLVVDDAIVIGENIDAERLQGRPGDGRALARRIIVCRIIVDISGIGQGIAVGIAGISRIEYVEIITLGDLIRGTR